MAELTWPSLRCAAVTVGTDSTSHYTPRLNPLSGLLRTDLAPLLPDGYDNKFVARSDMPPLMTRFENTVRGTVRGEIALRTDSVRSVEVCKI